MIDIDDLQKAVAGYERRPATGCKEAPWMMESASVESTPRNCVDLGEHDNGVTEPPHEPKEVRRRIKQGRIQIKRTTGNRLIGHAQSVLMTFGVMMSCIAGHLLEPASQIS